VKSISDARLEDPNRVDATTCDIFVWGHFIVAWSHYAMFSQDVSKSVCRKAICTTQLVESMQVVNSLAVSDENERGQYDNAELLNQKGRSVGPFLASLDIDLDETRFQVLAG
jgi:hypothetical protein